MQASDHSASRNRFCRKNRNNLHSGFDSMISSSLGTDTLACCLNNDLNPVLIVSFIKLDREIRDRNISERGILRIYKALILLSIIIPSMSTLGNSISSTIVNTISTLGNRRPSSFLSSKDICATAGCNRKCYVESNGHTHPYCGRTCAQMDAASKPNKQISKKNHQSQQSRPTSMFSNHQQPSVNSQANQEIKFYNRGEPYFEFTNFYEPPNGILIDGYFWRNSEGYYQASKFQDIQHVQKVNKLRTPREAFDYARTHKSDQRPDWFHVNKEVMRKALCAKFSQHPDLLRMLLETGDSILIEHTINDSYWGDGGDGSGENHLGNMLMQLREEMKGCLLPKR